MSKSEFHRADEKRFLDERGGSGPLAPNGLNPATIMEKAVRERIVESYFYKEQCYGVNEADIVDRVVEHVDFIGGTYGISQKPSPFLCLAFKLLQLAPNDAVLDEYLRFGGDKFKYLRALAAFYIRLTRADKDVYTTLEPLLEDRRKLRRKGRAGTSLTFVDEFVDDLLTKDRVCATTLWKMRKRDILEDLELLEPRVSPLGNIEDLLEEDEQREKDEAERKAAAENGHDDRDSRGSSSDGSVRSASQSTRRTRSRSDSRSRSRSRSRRGTRSQSDSRSRSRRRSRSTSQSRPQSRSRSRSRSGEEGEVSDHDRMDVDRPERRGPGRAN
ncbi:PRP38 family-domain-containing protein [Lasiosphaeria ovina]|uniref:Pre-mRNA-splicing factor 38 n=1 Tax=Lasiosphaeria ovina TaxID=92902 RepID=A0AAE0N0S4_9PEZI|nr:PRP38 family-domain-containing protein [Lasiosphaeria ovina]